jgi:hypothetical protein
MRRLSVHALTVLVDAGPDRTISGDGALSPKGEGYIPCNTDVDCSVNSTGSCTVTKQRLCFTDPITVDGAPRHVPRAFPRASSAFHPRRARQ